MKFHDIADVWRMVWCRHRNATPATVINLDGGGDPVRVMACPCGAQWEAGR